MPNSTVFMKKPLNMVFGITLSALIAVPVYAQNEPVTTVTTNADGSTTTTTVTKNANGSTTTKTVTKFLDGRTSSSIRTVGIPVSTSSSSTSSSTTVPSTPTVSTPVAPVLAPVVDNEDMSSYAQLGRIGQQLAAEPVRTLHQRRGEQVKFATDGQQTWVRVLNDRTKQEGKTRFEFTNRSHGVQVGHDIVSYDKDGAFNVTGGYIAHQSARVELNDRADAEVNAKLRSRALSFGLTHTRYAEDGSYLDLVGQFSRLQHRLDSEGMKQSGKNLLISAEVGKPFALVDGWKAEPQAQLVYQYQKLNSLNDEGSNIDFDASHNLKARLGGRLAYQVDATEIYAVANFWHDFRPVNEVNFKSKNYRETYARNSMDIGIGAQYAFNKNTALYGDVRYEYALGNHHKGGIRSDIGFKFSW